MNSLSNIEVEGTLFPFEKPVQSHHSVSATPKPNYVVKQVYQGKLVQTNEIPTPGLVLLGMLIILMGYSIKKIRNLSK